MGLGRPDSGDLKRAHHALSLKARTARELQALSSVMEGGGWGGVGSRTHGHRQPHNGVGAGSEANGLWVFPVGSLTVKWMPRT